MIIENGAQRVPVRLGRSGRVLLLIAVALLCGVILSCESQAPPHHAVRAEDAGASDGGAPAAADASTAPAMVTLADLAAAGLSVFADPSRKSPMIPPTTVIEPSPYRVLLDQANAMISEAEARQGVLGSDIDALIVVAADLPPASYFLAGYVSAAGTPGATLARRIMGTQDWVHAPTLVYPTLVFALFAADAARYANALADPRATGTASQPLPLPAGLCSDVTNFIDGTISGFFDALGHLPAPQIPSSGVGIIDWFGSGLQAALNLGAQVINGVIDAGRFVVVQGVKAATQPLLDAIATVAGPIGVAVEVIDVLRPWTIKMDANPLQTSRGVDPGAGLPGTITGTVTLPGGLDEWPALFVDCAKVAGVTLPALKPVGAPVTWALSQSPDPLIVQNPGAPVVLDDNASASIGYVTTTDTAKAGRGTAFQGNVKATITIRRKEIADLQKTVADAVFAHIPDLIRPLVKGVLGPAVDAILDLPPALLDTHGYQPLVVTYHECESGDCCPPDQIACGTRCIDASTDPANCGDCDNVCPSGQSCAGGVCIPPPKPATCTPACPAGQSCQNGACTPASIVGSCMNADGRFCADFTGADWTLALTMGSCSSGSFSKAPCKTAGRLGSCFTDISQPGHDNSYITRFYPGPGGTSCNTCSTQADCQPSHPCDGTCCDDHVTAVDAARSCGCVAPGDPGCVNWMPD